MSGYAVAVSGKDTVYGNCVAFLAKFQRATGRAIQRAARDCYSDSQTNCPVGNDVMKSNYHQGKYQGESYTHIAGTLKGSGVVNKIDDYHAEVSYGGESKTGEYCDYAWYVELGTYKMAAQPFLYPAFLYAIDLFMIDLQGIARQNEV